MHASRTRARIAVLTLGVLSAAACVPALPAAPVSPLAGLEAAATVMPAETPTPTPDPFLGVAPTPAPLTETSAAPAFVEGTLIFYGPDALPAGAIAEVMLVGDQFETLGSASRTLTGEPGPLSFRLEYDPAALDPKGIYALLARVMVDGRTAWATLSPAVVITFGNPTEGIALRLTPTNTGQ